MFRIFLIGVVSCCLLMHVNPFLAQAQTYLNGFRESVEGEVIPYQAPDPRAGSALLVRSLDSTRVIRWRTDPVPVEYNNPNVSFVWMFGMDAAPEGQYFTLSAGHRQLLRFKNPAKALNEELHYEGNDHSSLVFRVTSIDRHEDAMGYAILTLPASMIIPGQPVELEVNGTSSGSNTWYMTFELPVEERMDVRSQPLMIRRNGKNLQSLLVEMVNLGEAETLSIEGQNMEKMVYDIKPGYNSFRYYIPEVSREMTMPLTFRIGNEPDFQEICVVKPVRPWTVYFVQHTHTDIGYTRTQREILPEHLRFIDYALDFCDLTDQFPDDAKFRWTCESSWVIDQYLQRRPQRQMGRLAERVQEGRIEVTAMPFNLSEIPGETVLKNMLQPVKNITDHGLPVLTAMQDDVNGIAWSLADYFHGTGVKYLIMGEHAHRALIPFDRPTAFWWASPTGNKMLAFRGEHYMYGNFLEIHTGNIEGFSNNLLKYLDDLSRKEYPFDKISLQYSGYFTDNSPPSIVPNELIRAWNDTYLWPKLISATAGEFMKYVEEEHGNELEILQKAWPDWWTDGFGSAARETAASRAVESDMEITTGLFSLAAYLGSSIPSDVSDRTKSIYDQIILYDEHTFGAAESISDPYSRNSMEQWAEKSSYVWDALKSSGMLREEAMGYIQEHIPKDEFPSLAVFNTMNWSRSGPVQIYIDHEIIKPGEPFSIQDHQGNDVPVQLVSGRTDGSTWVIWAKDIPAMGYKSYRIIPGKGKDRTAGRMEKFAGSYNGPFFSVTIDPVNGGFTSFLNSGNDMEMADPDAQWHPGQLFYERLSERHQLELFRLDEKPQRYGLEGVRFDGIRKGPVWTSIYLSGRIAECASGEIRMEYRFYEKSPRAELIYSMNKKPVTDPEAVYVAFPVKTQGGKITFDVPGGLVQPGKDQIPGTASDWNTVQHFVAVGDSSAGRWIFSSPEIPLYQLGGLNLGNFYKDHKPASGHIYSWVMNNYWTTNFRAAQEGEFTWRYFITYSGDPDMNVAYQFGWSSRSPLVGRVFPPGRNDGMPDTKSMFSEDLSGLLLISAGPGPQHGTITLGIREISGILHRLDPQNFFDERQKLRWREVDALGNPVEPVKEYVEVQPYSVCFIEARWEK